MNDFDKRLDSIEQKLKSVTSSSDQGKLLLSKNNALNPFSM